MMLCIGCVVLYLCICGPWIIVGWATSLQLMASLHFVLVLPSQIGLFIRNIDSQQVLAIGMLFYIAKAMSEIYGRIWFVIVY